MCVEKLLKPYYKRFYVAYLLKIGLLTMSGLLAMACLLLGVSKLWLFNGVQQWLIGVTAVTLIGSTIVTWLYRPSRKVLNEEIDALGFENRVATYLAYKGKENPFCSYLEEDLTKCLENDSRYKMISLKPNKYLLMITILLMSGVIALNYMETDISREAERIAEEIQALETEEEALLEKLKESVLDPEEMAMLEASSEEYLETIKDGLRQQDRSLIEENMFKLESSVEEALSAEGLPDAVKESLEGMKEIALNEESSSLLATLGQSSMNAGSMSEGDVAESNGTSAEGSQSGDGNQGNGDEQQNSAGQQSSDAQQGNSSSQNSQSQSDGDSGNGT